MDTKRKQVGELPIQLVVTEDWDIGELLAEDGITRILLSPSKCYLNDKVVQLEAVIEEIVKRYNGLKPKLFQLHHQYKKDLTKTEMVSQAEIYCNAQMGEWWKETAREKPLPEGYGWMMCNEQSEYFVKAVTDNGIK